VAAADGRTRGRGATATVEATGRIGSAPAIVRGGAKIPPVVPLQGIYPALVTPLRGGDVDRDACRRLIDHVVAGGVDGVLVLGSSGEGAVLTPRMRRTVVDAVANALAGRRPFVVGVITSSVAVAIEDVRHAARAGAMAVLVAPPHFGPVDDDGALSFYRALSASARLPIVAYNIPAFTRVAIRPDVVETLAREGTIAGIKDSSRDFDYFQEVLTRLRGVSGFRALTGTDSLLVPAQVSGAHGAITVGANLVPEWCVSAWTAAAEGRWAEAMRWQERLVRLGIAIRRGTFPAGMKAALALRDVCGEELAVPGRALDAAERRLLKSQLVDLEVLPAVG
jgi:4-hydroxy-tetrahydrodipicolinate synthase